MSIKHIFILVSIVAAIGCSDYQDLEDIELEENQRTLAVPLVNAVFDVQDFAPGDESNFAIQISPEDEVTVVYRGDVIERTAEAIFPPIPLYAVPLLDSVTNVALPFQDQDIYRAIFAESNVGFLFNSNEEEDIEVTVTSNELLNNGEPFNMTFTIPYEGTSPVNFTSDLISLKGWTLETDNDELTIKYDARKQNGERIKLPLGGIQFDQVVFDYVEGYFGSNPLDIQGDFVPIGILDAWKSGGLFFEDPTVKVTVDNSFGFPVRSNFQKMQVETVGGETFDFESPLIDNNVDFDYPTLDEVGAVKQTTFVFDKDNSNIQELFQERVKRVIYDVDALANPEADNSIIGFLDTSSFFRINVDVNLPLEGSINQLVLEDTIDLDLTELSEIDEAEFKSIITNDFPATITLQAYFINGANEVTGPLFQEPLMLDPAELDANGRTIGGTPQIFFENFDEVRYEDLKQTKSIAVSIQLNTVNDQTEPLWIYEDYGITFQLGALFKATVK